MACCENQHRTGCCRCTGGCRPNCPGTCGNIESQNLYPNGTVFYTGPCPPPSWESDCDWPFPRPCGGPVYGRFESPDSLSLAAGANIPFDSGSQIVGGLNVSGEIVTIAERGLYLAVFSLYGMATAELSTRVCLYRNNVALPCSCVYVNAAVGETVRAVGQAFFNAEAGTQVRVVTQSPLSITGTPAATLTLVRVG